MKKLFNRVFGNYSEKEVKRIEPIIKKILDLDEEFSRFSDEELKGKTIEFRSRLEGGETLDDILVESFATVREAAYRVLGMKHYKVQLIGGFILHQGRVAEMKTGEGKTLVGTLPAYLNGLSGKGVHIITSNEYLAQRDCEEMGQVHKFLGLTVGVVLHEMTADERREVYDYDISYGINSELGFDYLKDNMVKVASERVQRGLNYAIIDEIDSILVDEARTPLIISGAGEEPSQYYIEIDQFVKGFKVDEDYELDEKQKSVTLTSEGIDRIEKHYEIENFADMSNIKINHHITQALKANFIMIKDIDYIESEEEEIQIVDTFTGRVMDGRRFSDGLHQAIEAKEDVDIKGESQTLATITLQNLFRGYKKMSGMSGTVLSEEKEFQEVYNVDVITIPTNKPIARIDRQDKVYPTIVAKYNAIVEDIIEINKKGRPILVGTASIQKSEDISALLKRKGIAHNVLNAKNHKNEALIISNAGDSGAITIATNMAGRGTDIKISDDIQGIGGLKVIGTERHDSIRIDNQLRGRAGRQGDAGESLFFVSLEDDMVKNFISDKNKKILAKLDIDKDEKITFNAIDKVIAGAQSAVEGDGFASRKNVVGYDDVLNKQRIVIYGQRNTVLDNESIEENIYKMIEDFSTRIVMTSMSSDNDLGELVMDDIIAKLDEIGCSSIINFEELKDDNKENIIDVINQSLQDDYKVQRKQFSEEINDIEKTILLESVDKLWIEYMSMVDYLKLGIGLRSYKQIDPTLEFQMEASDMFIEMNEEIKTTTIVEIYKKLNALREKLSV